MKKHKAIVIILIVFVIIGIVIGINISSRDSKKESLATNEIDINDPTLIDEVKKKLMLQEILIYIKYMKNMMEEKYCK